MTDRLAALPGLLVPALGHALLDFVWQGLLIGLLAAVALQLLRDARPQPRYAVACLAMLACVLVPAAGVVAELFAPASDVTAVALAPLPQDGGTVAPTAFGLAWPMPLEATLPEAWLPLLVALWAAGTSGLSLRMALGVFWIRHLRAIPQGPAQAAWQSRLDALARRFGLPRRVALRVVDHLDSPMSAGWLRPVVLLPAALLGRMPVDLLEALLAHELAHIRRHDYLVNLLQCVAEALLFYHPVTWWLSRRIRIEREQVADRLAAEVTGEPRRLAHALSTLAELADQHSLPLHPVPPHLAQAAHGGQLMSRIQQLVQPGRRAAGGRIGFPLAGLAAACIAMVAHAQVSAPEPLPEPSSAPAAAPAAPAEPASSPQPAPMPAPKVSHGPVLPMPAPHPRPARDDDGERHDAFALVRHGEQGMTMSGSSDDIDDIRAARAGVDRDFVWFRRGGDAYLIDDPAVVARARAAWRDVDRLGPRMRALGDEMRARGAKLDALGERMRELTAHARETPEMRAATARMRELADRQRELASRQRSLAADMVRADGARRTALEARMETLSGRMETLAGQMRSQGQVLKAASARLRANQAPIEALSQRMREASKPMEALGERMRVLGRQQQRHARAAEREIRALIEEARRDGLARPAPGTGRQ